MEPGGEGQSPPHPLPGKVCFLHRKELTYKEKNLSTWGFFPGSFFDFAIFFETSSNSLPSSQEKNLGRVELERY